MKYHLRRVTSAEFELLAARFGLFDLRFFPLALSPGRGARARGAPRAPREGGDICICYMFVLCVVEVV